MTIDLFNAPLSSHRKTKIVATIGPASKSPEKIKELILEGANVFRLNFSHGSHQDHLEILKNIRKIEAELKIPVAILQDLSGPKIRISNIADAYLPIEDGKTIVLKHSKGEITTDKTIYVEALDPVTWLQPEQQVLLADGIITLQTLSVNKDSVTCKIIKGGRIRSRVGIAFPDTRIDIPATTEKDLIDLTWGIENEVDYVAISFVQTASDVTRIKDAIRQKNKKIRVISKIERKSALDNIFDILDVSDGLMVARGDLGLEVPVEHVPVLQKRLISYANYQGIPVIVATQMLHSMITASRPTRAEVSDVSTAVISGTDAVMLSEETAIGEYPKEAVGYLNRIARRAEAEFTFDEYQLRLRNSDRESIPDAIAYGACAAANKIKADALVACTETGMSARLMAKYRPQQPLYGASFIPTTLRQLALMWGVIPIHTPLCNDHEEELQNALQKVQLQGNFPNGSKAVITSGLSINQPGSTSLMEVKSMDYN